MKSIFYIILIAVSLIGLVGCCIHNVNDYHSIYYYMTRVEYAIYLFESRRFILVGVFSLLSIIRYKCLLEDR